MSGVCKRLISLLIFCLMATAAQAQDYTGWWWDPSASGTGYSLEVQDAPGKSYDVAYMVWYLYNDAGVNTWYSSVMKVTGNTMTGDLAVYDGWPLEPGVVSTAEPADIGDVTMTFADINNGAISYTIDGATHSRTIERWEQNGTQDPRDILGWWWDTDKQGVGWFIESRNDRFFLGWYNYRALAARTGGMPRWYITVDFDFAQDQTVFSSPLLDYSGGQTATGAYQEPTAAVDNAEQNFEISLPAGTVPGSIALLYEGNSFNLTRFTIPDIFDEEDDCAPVQQTISPPDGGTSYVLKPVIQAKVKTPCGSAIDNDSIVFKLNGAVMPHTVSNATPDQADIRYIPPDSNMLTKFTYYLVQVTVANVNGETTTLEWSFMTDDDPYAGG